MGDRTSDLIYTASLSLSRQAHPFEISNAAKCNKVKCSMSKYLPIFSPEDGNIFKPLCSVQNTI
jgi:hypothetical protein